tara:strand:+ start:459 stop:1232 length:774 start_codon:yes stop_codon:yes gene_type:complete
MDVTIEEITVDPQIVGRSNGLDFVTIQTYADDMESGAVFPAVEIVSDGSSSWLVDGQHRLEAVKKLGYETITANVTEGDYRDALLKSCGTNAEHGKRRTNEDKRQKVLMLLEDEEWSGKSGRWIARQCKVDEKFVRKMRDLTADIRSDKTERTYVTKHGTISTMNITNIGGNNKEKEIQRIKEEYSKPPLKYLLAEYASLLTKANVVSKAIVTHHDEFDIRGEFEKDKFLRSGVSKAIAVNNDFIEGVKNGFQSKSS